MNYPDTRRMDYPDGTHLVGLTFSGGGARAAVFSAAVIFELTDLGLIDKVNIISGASGGALTAAYYAVTCDDTDQDACETIRGLKRRKWSRDEAYDRLNRNFLLRSLLWRFEPFYHLPRTVFTAYDNTEIYAAVLSDNLYDEPFLGGGVGRDFKFEDINPERPFLVINATNATGASDANVRAFQFTKSHFDSRGSDLCTFKIGRAVAASSAFPAVFNYSTLSRYICDKKTKECKNNGYVHLFDAGASDNLAIGGILDTTELMLRSGPELPKLDRITIFVVDAQNGFNLRSSALSDPRFTLDFVVDRNFIDVYDILMEQNYGSTIEWLDRTLRDRAKAHSIFHVALKALQKDWNGYGRAGKKFHADALKCDSADGDDPPCTISDDDRKDLLNAVNGIKTKYGLEEREVRCLAASAHVLVEDLRPELKKVFDNLHKVSQEGEERFREDRDACLLAGKRGRESLIK